MPYGDEASPDVLNDDDPACTWWNRPEEDNSSGKLESTHPSRTSVKSDQGFFGVESVMRVNADSLLIRAAATSTSGTLNDLTTDLIMANNNNNKLFEDYIEIDDTQWETTRTRGGRVIKRPTHLEDYGV